MNTNGRQQIGECMQDNLIAGNRHPVDVCHIVIREGQKLSRGSLLEEDPAEEGKYVLRGTQSVQEAAKAASEEQEGIQETEETQEGSGTAVQRAVEAEYILAEDVDASDMDKTGLAYRTGEFAENALIVKEGYEITEADRKELRKAGIFLARIMM